jgi:DNA polymerase-3 subunit epsilon
MTENKISALKKLNELQGEIAFLDTETSGLKGEVVEISIIDIEGIVILSTLIKPFKMEIEEGAAKTPGITLEEISKAEPISFYSDRIMEAFSKYHILIYNKEFDIQIMRNSISFLPEEEKQKFKFFDTLSRVSDMMSIYTEYFGEINPYPKYGKYKNQKLTRACEQQGIDISDLTAHRSLADCEIMRRLFLKLQSEAIPT